MGINKIILVGNVGKEPEVRHLGDNMSVANFSLATSETFNKNGEKITNTEWHNITAWNWIANFAEKHIKKGMMLYVEGKLRTTSYNDKNGGKRYKTEVIAEKVEVVNWHNNGGNTKSETPLNNDQNSEWGNDLPF